MKKILLLAALFCSSFYSMAGTINISTSTNAGAYVAPPNTDPNWKVSSSLLSLTAAYAVPSYGNAWEATPVAVTNAGWISPTPNQSYDVPGIYTFERSFPVSQCTQSIACNFKIAFDDTLILLELVPPSGPSIPLTVSGGHYFLSSAITNVVTSPAPGLWKVRATVHYIDELGGFILSGSIDDTPLSDCCKENVSTGISNNWVLAPGSPVGPATYVIPPYTPYWQPTPVPPLNSQWISPT
ncbi:MAG TPA: hypothetical protein PL045_02135, partial [Chitinophagaceae bacterium]|nr:hypothetical protein [Chitinophagaceae bacterium]